MATSTTNYSFDKPEVGADTDAWGGFLNGNWDSLDTILDTIETTIAANKIAAQIPVGGLYFSGSDTDPATTLGYGTWTAHAAGRAIVGVGSNGESTWTIGEENGSETHALSVGQMPNHTHKVNPPNTNTTTNGNHTHTYDTFGGDGSSGEPGGDGSSRTRSTNAAGNHNHSVNIAEFDSGSQGGSLAHPNIQPSIGVYVWRRTV